MIKSLKISIIELDELFSYCPKPLEKSTYGWLAVNRRRNTVVDFEVTSSRDFLAYLLLEPQEQPTASGAVIIIPL